MTAYATAPTAAYQQQSILTAPPERLVVMLYDGAHRFLTQAAALLRADEPHRSDEKLGRAEAIIDELHATLNFDAGEIAERLQGIYVFCRGQLMEARLERNPDKMDWVAGTLGELRESWAQIAATAG